MNQTASPWKPVDSSAIWSQQKLRSCTAIVTCDIVAQALGATFSAQGNLFFSPLFLYYNARKLKGYERNNVELGCADIFAAMETYGLCPEALWPYEPKQYRIAPSEAAYAAALPYCSLTFSRVPQTLESLCAVLAKGQWIMFGLRLFADNHWDFYKGSTAESGQVKLPESYAYPYTSHAMLIVDYLSDSQEFVLKNSFGEEWGRSGYATIAAAYILEAGGAFDFYEVAVDD